MSSNRRPCTRGVISAVVAATVIILVRRGHSRSAAPTTPVHCEPRPSHSWPQPGNPPAEVHRTAGSDIGRGAVVPASDATNSTEPAEWADASLDSTLVAWTTLVISAWVAMSNLWLRYPSTGGGPALSLWTGGLGIGLLVAAAARARAPMTTWRSAIVLVVASPALFTVPILLGLRPMTSTQHLSPAEGNLMLSGAVLTVLSAVGLAQISHRRRRHQYSPTEAHGA